MGKLKAGAKWIGQFRLLATHNVLAMPVLADASSTT